MGLRPLPYSLLWRQQMVTRSPLPEGRPLLRAIYHDGNNVAQYLRTATDHAANQAIHDATYRLQSNLDQLLDVYEVLTDVLEVVATEQLATGEKLTLRETQEVVRRVLNELKGSNKKEPKP